MARVRMEKKCILKNWDDVNLYLAEIGEQERKIEQIQSDMQAEIDEAKLKADDAAKPCQKRISELSEQINMFADENISDLNGKKTKTMTFGSVGYRKSTKIGLPRAAAKVAAIISKLRLNGMTDCIVIPPEKIDKDALKKYSPDKITKVGANLVVEDVFWYEVDKEQLTD